MNFSAFGTHYSADGEAICRNFYLKLISKAMRRE